MNPWQFISDPQVQATLSWIGGGIAAVAAGLWAVIRARRTTATGGVSVRGRDGIVSSGPVSFRGRLNITRGVPAWVIFLGFAGLLLLGLRLLAEVAEHGHVSAEEARELVTGSAMVAQSDQIELLILLDPGGVAQSFDGEGRYWEGDWRIRDDGAVCLDVPGSLSVSGCYLVRGSESDWRFVGAEEGGTLGSLLGTTEGQEVTAVALAGRWAGSGYRCGQERLVQLVEVSNRGNSLEARKVTGDECVVAGEITWRGSLNGDVITVSGQGRHSDGGSVWHPGQIRVLSEDLMIWKIFGYDEPVVLRRVL